MAHLLCNIFKPLQTLYFVNTDLKLEWPVNVRRYLDSSKVCRRMQIRYIYKPENPSWIRGRKYLFHIFLMTSRILMKFKFYSKLPSINPTDDIVHTPVRSNTGSATANSLHNSPKIYDCLLFLRTILVYGR